MQTARSEREACLVDPLPEGLPSRIVDLLATTGALDSELGILFLWPG